MIAQMICNGAFLFTVNNHDDFLEKEPKKVFEKVKFKINFYLKQVLIRIARQVVMSASYHYFILL